MALRKLPFNFHDSGFLGYQMGPRRELNLRFWLDPVWNDGQAKETLVRLSSIQNWDQVKSFFSNIPASEQYGRFVDSVEVFVHHSARKDTMVFALNNYGSIEIGCRGVTIT